MKNRFVAATSVLACLHVVPVFAQDSVTAEPVIVTATRTARTADQTLAAVTVLTREDIERTQAVSVPELLRGLPGIDQTVSGGYGKQSSMFVRGTESDHVLVLVDGVQVGSPTTGAIAWDLLPVDQIERIEVVRGPHSALYGADAIGGVVQIFTRAPTDKPRFSADAGAGTHRTQHAAAGMSGKEGDIRYSLNVARFATDGINATRPAGLYPINEPDTDGYENNSATARLAYRFANNGELEGHFLTAQGETEFDGFENETDFRQRVAGIRMGLSPAAPWRVTLSAGEHKDDADNFKDGAFSSAINTRRQTLSWQNDLAFADQHLITAGADYYDDQLESTVPYAVTQRDNVGVFGQYQADLGPVHALAALRRDDNKQFGTHDTGNVAAAYAFDNKMRVRTSYGTAFHAPTFNDLYWPGAGNPNLKPEESENIELGLSRRQERTAWEVNVFHTIVDNLIVFDGIPQNIQKARINGLETSISTTWAKWLFRTQLTLLDPRDEETDKQLRRRARSTGAIDIDRTIGRSRVGIGITARGPHYEDAANVVRMPGYVIVNLRYQRTLSKTFSLQARVENALDKEYETVEGYHGLDRSVFLSLAYRSGGV